MQAIILAAGMGKRLRHETKSNTKCMVKINGRTMIERSLDNITRFSLSRIVIVVGYKGGNVRSFLGDQYNGVPIIYVENRSYATTNNIYSLALASEYMSQDDTLLLESDLVYEYSIIERLLSFPCQNVAVVDKYQAHMDGTVVEINDKFDIKTFIPKKHFDYRRVGLYYKTVNIYKFSKEFINNSYLPFLKAYSVVLGYNQYYEQVLRVLLTLEQNNLKAMPLNGERWYEIDDLQDLSNAELIFSDEASGKLKKFHSRFGGYWRFSGIRDFCYLVNPYFPPKRMCEECKYSFESLLSNYPSGHSTQKLLVENVFNCSEKNVLVGNGAAELISTLLSCVHGKIAVNYPTFQEYPARISSDRLVRFLWKNDFSYNAAQLLDRADEFDCLILINPDNPSGNYVPKDELVYLIGELQKKGKFVILDESFVDFSSGGISNSLLTQEILDCFDNLVVVKSISKSYGVPGIRLGIMASSNSALINEVRKKLPIWNINSFAEFFLQILPKYTDDYRLACQEIASVRDSFGSKLTDIPFLRVLPSQANYFLCEVLPPYTAKSLCEQMLGKFDILLKDCSEKEGFDGRQFVRIAVRDAEDNKFLIDKLCLM